MSKNKPIQIHIPQPCHEDWAKMTPQQKGRFCDSCQKCVVDFTNFTDTELYTFLQEHKDQKVCGRFKNTQLNRAINLPPQPHSTLYKWIVAAGLALVISTLPNSPTFAQAPVQQEQLVDWNDKKTQHDSTGFTNVLTGEPAISIREGYTDSSHKDTIEVVEQEEIMGLIAPPPVVPVQEEKGTLQQIPARNTDEILKTVGSGVLVD